MLASPAIRLESLVKRYGDLTALRGISFEVAKGETFALLGVNGAGKTTTLECIEGLRRYDSGLIEVDGRIGVQLQSSSLPGYLQASEVFGLFSRWNGAAPDWELFDAFGLTPLRSKQYRSMSAGQKRRLHLALALIGDPDIVFLDEPTAGLDVEGKAALHAEIRRLKQQGKTIVIASHDMLEVESLCDRIAILKNGLIRFIGTPQELTSHVSGEMRIHIRTSEPLEVAVLQHARCEGTKQGYHVFATLDLGDGLMELLSSLKRAENAVLDIRIEHPSLEQRFLDIAQEQ